MTTQVAPIVNDRKQNYGKTQVPDDTVEPVILLA